MQKVEDREIGEKIITLCCCTDPRNLPSIAAPSDRRTVVGAEDQRQLKHLEMTEGQQTVYEFNLSPPSTASSKTLEFLDYKRCNMQHLAMPWRSIATYSTVP